MSATVDRRLTFSSFVVGPENRLAWEAARTAAESPGSIYNPLFMYSHTGLGKTHLLVAIANRASELQPDIAVIYTPVEQLLRDLDAESGAETAYRGAEVLLIDDLQFIGHHSESHRVLFSLLDDLLMGGRQVALACDRPPLELGELDDRLLSRFSGGLVVDIGRPVLETRKAILEARLAAADLRLRPEVVDAIARLAIENVRQLKGALNRVIAAQKVEGREIRPDEVDRLLADVVGDADLPWLAEGRRGDGGEFQEFLTDVSSAVERALSTPKWREDLARSILKWEAEGYSTRRLEELLEGEKPVDSEHEVAVYEEDIETLKGLEREFSRLQIEVPNELSLKDPDRITQLQALLERVRRAALAVDDYFLDREKVIWDWPVFDQKFIESWDDGDQR